MPRASADRKFGYKVDGLVRILTAADADEVLKALTILGLDVTQAATLDDVFEQLVMIGAGHVFRWLEPLESLMELVTAVDEIASESVTHDYALTEAGHVESTTIRMSDEGRKLRGLAFSTQAEFTALRDEFTRRMQEAKLTWPDVVWPATPGVFEEG